MLDNRDHSNTYVLLQYNFRRAFGKQLVAGKARSASTVVQCHHRRHRFTNGVECIDFVKSIFRNLTAHRFVTFTEIKYKP
jgi:hypothetical protein